MGKLPFQLLAALIGLAIGAFLAQFLGFQSLVRYGVAILAGAVVGGAIGSTAAQMNLQQKFERGSGIFMYAMIAGGSAAVGVLLSPRLMALLRF